MAKLNAEHIEQINSALEYADGNYEKASEELKKLGWDKWDSKKVWNAVHTNKTLKEQWVSKAIPEQNAVQPPATEETDIHRPLVMTEIDLPESIQEGKDALTVNALECEEYEFRKHLKAIGENDDTANIMVAAGALQSKFALCTLNSVTGLMVKSYNEIRKAQAETLEEIRELLSVEDPVAKALLSEREKVLRDFYIQLHNCQTGAFDRISKAFYLQLEAHKLKRGANGRPKKMLGITAMPGSNVAVSMGSDRNGGGDVRGE
jgi:hypothetical protein